MIRDYLATFDNNVALTATRVSTYSYDLGSAGINIGDGENLYYVFSVTTTLASGGGTATLQVAFETDDDVALGSPVIVQDEPAVITEATCVVGFTLIRRIRSYASYLRYIGMTYTVGTENFTSGKISCGLVHGVQDWKSYPNNFDTA